LEELKCYTLCTGASQRNLPLFATYVVYPVYVLATILSFMDGLALGYVALHLIIIFSVEWLMRNFVLCQRPGYVCLEKNKLSLWYFAGMLRIEYLSDRFQVLEKQKDEHLRLKIKKRILLLKIHPNRYHQFSERPGTLDLIKIVKK
jgi:hypothetical protein